MEQNLNSGNYNLPEDDNLDIKRYLSLFISNWYWFAISLFIALSLAYGINRYSSKLFTISSTLMIIDDQYAGANKIVGSVIPGGDIFRSKQNITNEISILRSFSLNKRVIDSLPDFKVAYYGVGKRNIAETQLYKDCPIRVTSKSINVQPPDVRINIIINSATTYSLEINGSKNVEKGLKFGQTFNKYGFNFIIELRDGNNFKFNPKVSNKFYFYFTSSDELANTYRANLNVTPIEKDATIVNLTKTGSVPEQEADYLNKLMDVYIWQGLESKNQIAVNTMTFIDEQLHNVSDSLRRADSKLQKLRLDNKLIDLSKDGNLLQTRLEKFEN
jgi:tyrosine-protein kinase Etk/Wzc